MSWSGASRIQQGFRMLHGIFRSSCLARYWVIYRDSRKPSPNFEKGWWKSLRKTKDWRSALKWFVSVIFQTKNPDPKSGVIWGPQKHPTGINPGSFIQTPPFLGVLNGPSSLIKKHVILRQGRQQRKALPDESFVSFVKQKVRTARSAQEVTSHSQNAGCHMFFLKESR